MKKLILSFTIIATIGLCCKDSPPTKPPDLPKPPTNCEYPPGNRSFTWRLDTVAWFPSWLGGVHAFSDTDAYVIGNIVDGKPPYISRMGRHWNGREWEDNIHGTLYDITVRPYNDVTGDDHVMVAVGFHAIPGYYYAGIAEFNNTTKKWKSYQLEALGELRGVWTDGKGFFIAVGDNGMVYTKDGYTADWVYQKAPTEFNLTRVTGVSKNEVYSRAYISLPGGQNYQQYWKYNGVTWFKLYDGQDTTGTPVKLYNTDNGMYDIGASRCIITDSIKIFLIGWESFLLETKGQSFDYKITNLTDIGLPLRNMGRTALRINMFSPNDFWIFGTRYNFYHWNGENFQKIIIPGLPNDDMRFGYQLRMVKTKSGKIFLPTEISSQVYVIVQGTP